MYEMHAPVPRITIVTPSYNQAAFIEQTLKSVLDQDYPNLEYIVIDGGSSDGSVEIINRYSDRLAYSISEADRGHGNALNKGFAKSTGEIMAWLNSDDLYLPWTLETVAEIFAANKDVCWITGIHAFWDERGRLVDAAHSFKNKYDYLQGRYAWIQQESTFWRRELWDAIGGHIDESFEYMIDGNLWSRFFLNAKLYHVRCILGGYRQWGGNRASANVEACHREMQLCVESLRHACDRPTLRNSAKLRWISTLARALPLLPVRKMASCFDGGLNEETGYDLLVYNQGEWAKEKRPFLL